MVNFGPKQFSVYLKLAYTDNKIFKKISEKLILFYQLEILVLTSEKS